jgi:putative RecB family exonuclease
VDKVPEPRTLAQARGTVTHLVLERVFDLAPAARTPDAAAGLVPKAVDDAVGADPSLTALIEGGGGRAGFVDQVTSLVRADFSMEDPSRLAPEARELWVEAPIGGPDPATTITVRGYIDRLDVAPGSGALRIVDYKTGKAPRPAYQSEALFQLRCYGLAIWRMRGTMPAMLQLLYLASGTAIREEPTRADLERTEARLLALWAGIVRCARTAEWPAVRGPLCPWCAFQALCPAFDATPPVPPDDTLARLGIT